MRDNLPLNWASSLLCANQKRLTHSLILLIIVLCWIGPNSASTPPNPKERAVYKCYGQPEGRPREICYGWLCLTITHLNTNSTRLTCQNETEPDHELKAGECKDVHEIDGGSMPGQVEHVCACAGDYCNAASISNAWTSLGIFVAAALIALLTLS